jgi:hypothetical protein
MSSADDDLRARIEAFTVELSNIIRRRALEAVSAALGGRSAVVAVPVAVAPSKARPPVARKAAPAKAAPPAAPVKAAPAKAASKKRAPGQKRAPGEISALVEKLSSYINSHPGATMEAIRDALGTPSTELVVPAKKLISAGKVRAEGKKQLTRYFPV